MSPRCVGGEQSRAFPSWEDEPSDRVGRSAHPSDPTHITAPRPNKNQGKSQISGKNIEKSEFGREKKITRVLSIPPSGQRSGRSVQPTSRDEQRPWHLPGAAVAIPDSSITWEPVRAGP